MKGQVTIEELLSFGVYMLLLSMLIAAVFTATDAGEAWSSKTLLRAETASLARTHDAFYNANLYNPYENQSGSGNGYLEYQRNGLEFAVPVLEGKVEVAHGEPI